MIIQELQTNNVIIYNVPENNLKAQNLKNSHISSKTLSENDIIKGDTYSFVRIPNNRLEEFKNLIESEFAVMDIMPRKETEKEINRLDNVIFEIKNDVKEIKKEMPNLVTKDYLNNEFKNSLINEIKIMNQADKKEFRKWLITAILIPIIIALIPYIMDLGNQILTYIQSK